MAEDKKPRSTVQNVEEMASRAQEIYDGLRKQGDWEKVNQGKYIAIDVNSEKYFIGDTREEAISNGRAELPKVTFFLMRIGGVDRVSRHYPLPMQAGSIRARVL